MKTNEAPEKVTALSEPETTVPPGHGTDWAGLVWLTLLVAVGLTAFIRLEHFLFPQLNSAQHQAVTICLGTIAAVVGTYYATRRLDRAFALHAQAEKKLALERNVLRTVTDNIPDSIFAKDKEGRYLLANKAFATLHGAKSPDDLLGKTVFDLFPKDRANILHADDLQVMRSGGVIMETERTAVDPDGNLKVLQTTKVPLIDKSEEIVGIVGLHRDITRRKEAEHRLRQSEANLAAAQRIAHFGSVELDIPTMNEPEQKPVRWSDEVFRIFGYEPGSVEVSRQTYFRSIHPDDRENVRKALDKAIREAKPFAVDFRVVRPDGAERNILERGDMILDPKTKDPLKLVASIQDVTERVQAEIRLHNANQELAEKVQELEQRSKEISLLSEMGSHLQTCKDVEEAYLQISAAAEKLFPKWSGALCITTASRTAVETVADWGMPVHGERVFAPDDCWALRRGQPQLFRRGEKGSSCRHIDLTEVTESLCVPFMAQGEALGIVSLQMRAGQEQQESSPRSSRLAERRLAAVLVEQVALALGNLKLRETLRNQSICDPLTGLFNRRYMEESLEREFSRANRNKTSLAIIMMDIDHFKRFNDTFGHQAGDTLLRTLGALLKRNTRGQDIACRYGGEEFAFVLTDATLAGALQRAEILRQQVKQLSVEYAGQLLGAISVSTGVALYPDHGTTMGDVLRAADQALYCAKREGRDRINVWTAESVV
ncbi:MAG TPA: diguanylate cyclase [Candidatus Acidoferrales bacterium]|jgi:diguanylate cyclase (GGDEF)-like protein/PAS domain S-box-containing protein|nr:diguanylate cyclase [Candidatus Acidoferrales bacterium]